tara:strand:- start:64 stop:663 length:600 start_codon:yes stop_codon:yes gene_type:complete
MKSVTPEGIAVYPHLNEPDTEFDKDGNYSTKLAIPAEHAGDILEQLEAFSNESYKSLCKEQRKPKLKRHDNPWDEEYDRDGQPTGNILFKFKMRAKTRQGLDLRPVLVDAKRQPMTDAIGSGSKMKVAFEARGWFVASLGAGVTLRLRGVQVLNLVEFSAGTSASSLGFDEEQGFETVAKSDSESIKDDESVEAVDADF